MSETNGKSRLHMGRLSFVLVVVGTAVAAALITGLLVNIFERQQEAKDPFLKLVQVTEDTTDPEPWGVNFPRQYDTYLKTATSTRTRFGGHGGSEALPEEKIERDPWLKRMFLGYAFSIDYRDRRGHAFMLYDQEVTERVTKRPQPGSCLHCHSSVMPMYRELGGGDAMKGFEKTASMTYQEANAILKKVGSKNPHADGKAMTMKHVEGAHPVSCVDCHDPDTMKLRVTRPGFINGVKALMASQGKKDFDPNKHATRQEMRSYVCAQCHVEYYCGPKMTLTFPWHNGLRVEEIEKTYDEMKFPSGEKFNDWTHAESGVKLYKAQHPEFELWSQGTHAKAGVACADCHMPYERQGAMKVSDHWVRSPLLNIQRACQTCHNVDQDELKGRVDRIQQRNFDLLQRGGKAIVDLLDAVKPLRAAFEKDAANLAKAEAKAKETLAKDAKFATLPVEEQNKKLAETIKATFTGLWSDHMYADEKLKAIADMQRKAQWRLDFVAAENSMGFHAPQEAARILGEAIDYARQGQTLAVQYRANSGGAATTQSASK